MALLDFIYSAKTRLGESLAGKLSLTLGSFFGTVTYLVNGQDLIRSGIAALIMGFGGWYLGASLSVESSEEE